MTNDETSPNARSTENVRRDAVLRHSDFVIPSTFVIRASSFAASAVQRIFSILTIEFTKRADGRTVLRCVRDNGSVTWQRNENQHARFFPLHDLTHYAVESVLDFSQGFFGLLAAGWNIEETTGKSARGPLPDEAIEVEHLVSLFAAEWNAAPSWNASNFNEQAATFAKTNRLPAPRSLTDEQVLRVRERFNELVTRWRDLPDGETLRLTF